jgi:hypothetical protein
MNDTTWDISVSWVSSIHGITSEWVILSLAFLCQLSVPTDCRIVTSEDVSYRTMCEHNMLCFDKQTFFRDIPNAWRSSRQGDNEENTGLLLAYMFSCWPCVNDLCCGWLSTSTTDENIECEQSYCCAKWLIKEYSGDISGIRNIGWKSSQYPSQRRLPLSTFGSNNANSWTQRNTRDSCWKHNHCCCN